MAEQKLSGMMDLLKQSWTIYREKLQTILLIQLIPAVSSLIFGVIVGASVLAGLVGSQALDLKNLQGLLVGGGFVLVVSLILLILVTVWSQIGLMLIVLSEEKLGVSQALREAKKHFLPILWLGFLVFAILLGASFFLFIPALILSVWFTFSNFIVIVEGKKGLQALVASRRYVSGYFWPILLKVFGLSFFLAFALGIGVGIISSANEGLGDLVESVGNLMILSPLIMIIVSLIFKEMKAIKGEKDIEVTGKQRFVYGGLGIIGLVAIPVLSILMMNVLGRMNSAGTFDNVIDMQSEQESILNELDAAEVNADPEFNWDELIEEEMRKQELQEEAI